MRDGVQVLDKCPLLLEDEPECAAELVACLTDLRQAGGVQRAKADAKRALLNVAGILMLRCCTHTRALTRPLQ